MSRSLPVLRFFLLALLVLGILAKPVLAAECAFYEGKMAGAETSQSALAGDSSNDDDCCSFVDCGDCCTQAVDLRPRFAVVPAVTVAAPTVPALAVDFEPVAFAVAFRPPIVS